ncbi:MAG: glycoside hydrolase family 127 protein [Sedimentisphaerales bacterium]
MPARLAKSNTTGELYCLGHLIQATIAHYRATKDLRLLNALTPYVDTIINLYGPNKQPCWSEHPEIEMALVELYRTTGKKEYLNFAHFLLDEVDYDKIDSQHEIDFGHYFSGRPFTSLGEISGHAVCVLYRCCGAAGIYLETGDRDMWRALITLWEDVTQHKMYVTGGAGSRSSDEAIGEAYELPNERGYAETCAAIANVMWNWRLLQAGGKTRFADIMELALYNGALSGVSIDGDKYFCWNPHRSRYDPALERYGENGGDLLTLKKEKGLSLNVRQSYYRTPCCIPNIQRMIALLPGICIARAKRESGFIWTSSLA